MLADLRNHLFRHLQRLPLGFYERNRAGVLISRLTNDVEALDQLVTDGVTSLVQNTLTLVGSAGDPLLPRLATRVRDDGRRPVPDRRHGGVPQEVEPLLPRRPREARPRHGDARRGHLGHARAPGVHARAARRCATSSEVGDAYREKNQETVVQNALYFPYVDLLSSLATAMVLGYGGYLVFDGNTSIGVLVAFLGYLTNFFDPVQNLSQLYSTFLSAVAALDKIMDVLVEEPDVTDGPSELERDQGTRPFRRGALLVCDRARGAARDRPRHPRGHDCRARRPHGRRQVDDREADRALLRPDERPDHDRRDRPRTRSPRRACAGSSGSCRRKASCSPAPSPRTSRSGGRRRPATRSPRRREPSAPTSSSASSRTATTPSSASAGFRLSLGQRQLVAFARALLADPRILILDEATSSVDITTERRIERALRRLLHGRTAFVIAHRLSTIRDADRIVVLEHGGVVEQGTHEELLARQGRYSELYGSWAEDAA